MWNTIDLLSPVSNLNLDARGTAGYTGWPDDPETERLKNLYARENDPQKQREIAIEIQKRSYANVFYIPLGTYFNYAGIRSHVRNFVNSPVQVYWGVEKTARDRMPIMSGTAIWQWTAAETAAAIRRRDVSSEEVVAAHLDRMASENPRLNAVVVDLGESAIQEARRVDQRLARGEAAGEQGLLGVPITAKINVDIEGQANSNGLLVLKDHKAGSDAPVIANLREAGAIIIGLTNTPEFSMGGYTSSPLHGLTLNPWDDHITCGGSSGGACVAVAAGIGTMAHGNDIGGSLRWPAHCNGVASIKPTPGRIPSFNASSASERPIMAQLMACQGPVARSVKDLELALRIMMRGSSSDPWWSPAAYEGPSRATVRRAGLATIPGDLVVDPRMMDVLKTASSHLAEAGYELEDVDLPDLEETWQLWADLRVTEVAILQEAQMRRMGSDNLGRMIDGFRSMGRVLDLPGYMTALGQRSAHLRRWLRLFDHFDVILMPVSVGPTPPASAHIVDPAAIKPLFYNDLRFTSVVSILGLPAAVVPVGLRGSAPVGIQIASARYREDRCLEAAQAIEDRVGNLTGLLWQRQAERGA